MKPSVCFVALKAYAVLSNDDAVRHIGGAEVQQWQIARGLVKLGYRVCFVTFDHGQPDGESVDGMTVYVAHRRDAGVPGLRFLHPRATKTWSAMARSACDIYYQRTSDSLTGIVAAFCKRRGRTFVFAAGHDGDCSPELPFCGNTRERVLYRYGLKRAAAVVAQTRSQQENLDRHFNVQSCMIRSCFAGPDDTPLPSEGQQSNFLWVGRFAPEKRPELLLDVADRCPDVSFDVFGDGPATQWVTKLKGRMENAPNVRLHGYVPYRELGRHYARATALINTSQSEGFPNTFLEAWARGVPVVTSFDPDGVVEANDLGVCGTSADSLADGVRRLCHDPTLRNTMSRCAVAYFRENHTVVAAVEAYDRLFMRLASHSARPALRATTPLPTRSET